MIKNYPLSKQPQTVYVRQKSQRSNPLVFLLPFLIRRNTITIDYAASDRIASLPASIARVSLYGVNRTVFTFLYNACMVDCAISLPVEKDDSSCCRLIIPTLPLSVTLKPIYTVRTQGIFRYNPAFQIAALLGTPRYKAGTPFHTAFKTVPTPIGLTALIAELC